MKILLLGDASNYNATLASALAQLGHDVTLASNGGRWMQSERHIDLSRADNPLAGAYLYWKLLSKPELGRGYDAVFLCDTSFVTLRPNRQLEIFKHLKRHNGKVFLTFLGTNPLLVQNLTGPNPALQFSEWQTPWGEANKHIWLRPDMIDFARYVFDNVDGIATALYEYDVLAHAIVPGQKIVYTGIPVAPPPYVHQQQNTETLKILIALYPGREAEKGLDVLMPLLYRALSHYNQPFEIKLASGMPFSQFTKVLAESHLVVDQYYAFSPATTALMAMRAGVVPVTGGHPDWQQFIGAESAPVISTNPLDPEATTQNILQALPNLEKLSAKGPNFALTNTPKAVATRFNTLIEK